MSKKFYFPLLACVSILFTACDNNDNYNREYYKTYIQCFQANKHLINKGMKNFCTQAKAPKRGYYGPFMQVSGGQTHYYGYHSSGKRSSKRYSFKSSQSSSGLLNKPSTKSADDVSRGGFTKPKSSSSRSYSSSSRGS